jgi:HD superfamily phosphohydrolase
MLHKEIQVSVKHMAVANDVKKQVVQRVRRVKQIGV